MDIQDIKELMQAMHETGIDSLKLDQNGSKLVLKRHRPADPFFVQAHQDPAGPTEVPELPPVSGRGVGPAAGGMNEPAPVEQTASEEKPGRVVTAPVVGVYFAASSPDAKPFVEAGTAVKEGDVLCIIEAMKLMNEVTSPASGTVLEVLVRNGEKVEYGQPLMRIG